jgi:hypothetical protein
MNWLYECRLNVLLVNLHRIYHCKSIETIDISSLINHRMTDDVGVS